MTQEKTPEKPLNHRRILKTARIIVLQHRKTQPLWAWNDYEETLDILEALAGRVQPYPIKETPCTKKKKSPKPSKKSSKTQKPG